MKKINQFALLTKYCAGLMVLAAYCHGAASYTMSIPEQHNTNTSPHGNTNEIPISNNTGNQNNLKNINNEKSNNDLENNENNTKFKLISSFADDEGFKNKEINFQEIINEGSDMFKENPENNQNETENNKGNIESNVITVNDPEGEFENDIHNSQEHSIIINEGSDLFGETHENDQNRKKEQPVTYKVQEIFCDLNNNENEPDNKQDKEEEDKNANNPQNSEPKKEQNHEEEEEKKISDFCG